MWESSNIYTIGFRNQLDKFQIYHMNERTLVQIQLWNFAYIYNYLISPMKMRSLWEGKTYARNTPKPLNLCYILIKRGLDLPIVKIWGLLVKGLQSYQLSKLEVTRKSLLTGPGPSRTSRPGFELYRGQIILKVWWPVILQSFDL